MYKKVIALLTVLAILFSINALTVTAITDNDLPDKIENPDLTPGFTVEDRDVETGYLLRDNFPKSFRSGQTWERVNIKHPSSGATSVISKIQTYFEAYMAKTFVPQTGEFTVEFNAIVIDLVQSGSFRLGGELSGREEWGLRINIKDNELFYLTGSDEVVNIGSLKYGGFTGIRLDINVASKEVKIAVNGITVGQYDFTVPVENLGKIFFGIDAKSSGTLQLGTVYIYKGYALYEDLVSAGTGSKFDDEKDYNDNADFRATANNHAVSNNNLEKTKFLNDKDDSTYWEHDSRYSASYAYIRSSYKGDIYPIDTIRLYFAEDYNGRLLLTGQKSNGLWSAFDPSLKFILVDLHANASETREYPNGAKLVITGREIILSASTPFFATSMSVGFHVPDGVDPDDFRSIKLASFETYCRTDLLGYVPDFPDYWQKTEAEGTVANAHAYYGYTSNEEYNTFRLNDITDSGYCSIGKDFLMEESMKAEFKFSVDDYSDGFSVNYIQQDGKRLSFYTKDQDLYFGQFNELGQKISSVLVKDIKLNIWYDMKLIYDRNTGMAEIVLNGWNPVDNVEIDNSFKDAAFTRFEIKTEANTVGTFYVDEIKIFKKPPATTVPLPQPVDTGDTMLTMQACTLWREGTHQGWAAIDREETYNRKPILGWYDEGSSAVADWEIKIAVEHGISNMMYCWYHLPTGSGPIMKSGLEENLWKGVFNSEFKNYHKFSLMYTNDPGQHTANSFEEFITNYWPYFIEVFFKNPNYAKTKDNKPIFYIYDNDNFINLMGDISGSDLDGVPDGRRDYNDAKYAISVMRQMCIDEGFGGLYIAAEYRGPSQNVVANIMNSGYDSVFGYTWHPSEYNLSNDSVLSEIQQTMLAQKRAITKDNFNIIPTISKSWDPRGWNYWGYRSKSPIYMFDLEHYRQLALWCRDVFGGAPIADGQYMIMLDNWNEYSEGHWLFPTYGTPSYKGGKYTYGYLDILREVFGTSVFDHIDHLPLEEGYGPYDTWYPDGWNQPNDMYKAIYGDATDDSVKLNVIVDSVIGYNSTGGNTEYNATGSEAEGYYVVDAADCARVVVSKALIDQIKGSAGLKINLLHGSVQFTKEELNNVDGSLDIVLKQKIEISEVYNAVNRAANGAYEIYKGYDFRLETRINGYVADLQAEVTIDSKGADDVATVKDSAARKNLDKGDTFTFEATTNTDIVLIKLF